MKVYWTQTAIENLSAIYNYVAQTSPQYASRLVDRITKRSEQITTFPLSGRSVPEFETSKLEKLLKAHIDSFTILKLNK